MSVAILSLAVDPPFNAATFVLRLCNYYPCGSVCTSLVLVKTTGKLEFLGSPWHWFVSRVMPNFKEIATSLHQRTTLCSHGSSFFFFFSYIIITHCYTWDTFNSKWGAPLVAPCPPRNEQKLLLNAWEAFNKVFQRKGITPKLKCNHVTIDGGRW